MENIPEKGAVILAANHKSYLDPVLVGLASKRPVYFMAKSELFKIKMLDYFLKKLYAFPVKRGEFDRDAFRKSIEVLKSGKVMGIYPEGGRVRDKKIGEIKPGFSLIALKSKAAVVPVGIIGSDKAMKVGGKIPKFPKIIINIGKPFKSEDISVEDKRSKLNFIVKKFEEEINRLTG
ncbi:MAG: 1-acyl-sn-glycerol-3-phosphate acyltransferase [Actinomycetia bacterium]|nr:1-acyl-sn-glycerol-3-phosphate acyltransferase [Actinomycetes bacterium]